MLVVGVGVLLAVVVRYKSALVFQHFGDHIDCDAIYESTQSGVLSEARQGGVEFHKYLLRNLFDIQFVAHKLVAQVGDSLLILFDYKGVTLLVTRQDLL